MKAAERMAFYAERFSVTEIETSYRFPPTPAITAGWADRTPSSFRFDVQAWSLLTGQPTMPQSLWEDLADEVRTDRRDRPRLYPTHLSNDALVECWRRFAHALQPLHQRGQLGTVILRYPRWFGPGDNNCQTLATAREHLVDLPVAVELTSTDWLDAGACEDTFALLEALDISLVCIDSAPEHPRWMKDVMANTTDLAIVRLLGRKTISEEQSWSPDWRGYRYSEMEMRSLAKRLRHLTESAPETHVIVSTCWRDDAVVNAAALEQLLSSTR